MKSVRVLALASAMLAGAQPALAQQAVDYASVSGRVADQSGAVVQGAEITARQTQTNSSSTTITDQNGRFDFPISGWDRISSP